MKLVTFTTASEPRLGLLREDGAVLDLRSAGFDAAGTMLDLIAGGGAMLDALGDRFGQQPHDHPAWLRGTDVRLLAPIPAMPRNVFCVGRNYKLHIEEAARAKGIEVSYPAAPEFFTKPTTAVVGPDAGIGRYPALTSKLDYEVELAIVIGATVRDASPDEAARAIFGYTIVNDISARDLQMAHGQWFKGKALDTFCPIGPCIVTAGAFGDPSGHRITLRVNGQTRQDSTTADLLFGVPDIVARLSAGMTLLPGDIIATGTPSGVAFGMPAPDYLEIGDVVEAEVEGIGVLRNTIVA